MIRRLIEFIFGKPSEREQRIARQIRKMFEDAEKDGWEIVVDKSGIYRRKKE
jgi:hypothetical protein